MDDHLILPIIINPARILAAIIEIGWTETFACQEAHVSPATLRKLKSGRMVNLDGIRRLCKTLNIPVRDVVYGGPFSPAIAQPDLLKETARKRKLLESIGQAVEDTQSGEDSAAIAKRLKSAITRLLDDGPQGEGGRWGVIRGGQGGAVLNKRKDKAISVRSLLSKRK